MNCPMRRRYMEALRRLRLRRWTRFVAKWRDLLPVAESSATAQKL